MSAPGQTMSYTIDAGALGAIVAAIVGWLPPIAAVLAIAWYLLQFWESRTLQSFMQKRMQRKIMRLTARLASLQLNATADAAALDLKVTAKAAAKELSSGIKSYPHETEKSEK